MQHDIHSISGAAGPQGLAYLGDFNKLFVAKREDGKLRIYDGGSFKLLDTLDIGEDADNVRCDPTERRMYVGYGGDEDGGIAVVEANSGKRFDRLGAKIECLFETGLRFW